MTVPAGAPPATSLGTPAARVLATTTKTRPQMQEISSRWLLRVLPWVEVAGGRYRVNRRLVHASGDGRISFITTGDRVALVAGELRKLPLLHDLDDDEALAGLAGLFVQEEVIAGEVIAERGGPADQIVLVAHGKLERLGVGKYGEQIGIAVLAEGEYFGFHPLHPRRQPWTHTIRALTPATVLTLSRPAFEEAVRGDDALQEHLRRTATRPRPRQNKYGEAAIDLASGHAGEPSLPTTYVDYDPTSREYELSVAQTVVRVHSRSGDLYNEPMDQLAEQLRLTTEVIRERQEFELVNNPSFGLLPNADHRQRISTRTGPPTPDDLDDILTRRRSSQFFFAHPRAIAAFHRECNRRGLFPPTVDVMGTPVPAWRGVPLLSCNKIAISARGTTSILVARVGEEKSGVIGLHQTGLPDEYQPGLNVRFMGRDSKAVANYLVSAYYSAAILVPDALGVLENVEIDRREP